MVNRLICTGLLAGLFWLVNFSPVLAFCGFYVSKADTSLYNQASQVIIARDGNRTVLTMANDYQGEAKDFALVVPVPVVLKEEQVHIGDRSIIDRLDAFTAPRLVEYFDEDPCRPAMMERDAMRSANAPAADLAGKARQESALGVTIEERFSVGEYDILILSAKESNGLETWLRQNGYQIPKGAHQVLQPYIKQQMKFFVAKVNLEEYAKAGFQSLRPLMMAFESPRFLLPIRLGMVNAKGDQDLIVYLLSPKGQPELTSYRTAKIPTDAEIPEFVKNEFGDFYKALFANAYQKESKKAAFLEYAWDVANCDPCSTQPPTPEELEKAGVFWLDGSPQNRIAVPVPPSTFITRLHVRYSRDRFPVDLQFQETQNRQLFQGRYVMRHPYRGEMACDAASAYRRSVRERQEKEAQTLARLTSWNIDKIRSKIDFMNGSGESVPWWRKLWGS